MKTDGRESNETNGKIFPVFKGEILPLVSLWSFRYIRV